MTRENTAHQDTLDVLTAELPDLTPEEAEQISLETRATLSRRIDARAEAIVEKCLTAAHRGSRAKTARSKGRECPNCTLVVMGLTQASTIIDPERMTR